MTLIEQIANIVGRVPTGYEIIEYICSFFLLVFLCAWGYSMIAGIINSVIGRK